jgi:hypothetical protein
MKRERLKKELSVIEIKKKKLSHVSLNAIFLNLWLPKAKGYKGEEYIARFIDRLLMLVYDLNQHRNFTGTPLCVKIIATALEMDVEMHLKSRDFNVLPKIDLLYLYDRIVESKLYTDETEEKREDLTNASVQDNQEMSNKTYLENLEKCSLLVTLPSGLNPLSDGEIQTIQHFLELVQDRKDKIGNLMNVMNRRPQFVHRTLAEYLTARWFSKNFQSNRSLLERILFDSSYGIVKDVFDRILARGFPLHCAVLNRDTEAVETLLKGVPDVNSLDSGGRAALHLIASQGPGDHLCEEITKSLLRDAKSVDAEDNVLHFTPLGYAIKAENWLVVERLLEQQCNTNDLNLIRQRVDDESYIGRIIGVKQNNNYPLLFQQIANICENTRWAPLIDAAVERL